MKQRKGLGKGLEALLGDGAPQEQGESVIQIDIDLIDANTDQPRKEFDTSKLTELANSIREYGVIQPIIVTKNGDRYLIVAGERRYRAAIIAGLSSVPAIIRSADETRMLEIALIENIQREDLNPIEEAEALRFLMQSQHLTQDVLAKRIGKSRSAVANSVRLLTLPEGVRAMVADGKLSTGHAKVLLGIKDEKLCYKAAKYAVANGLSVRELELSLRPSEDSPATQKRGKNKNSAPAQHNSPALVDAVDSMRRALDTKVSIFGSEERGKIEIEYYSRENLEDIYTRIVGVREEN